MQGIKAGGDASPDAGRTQTVLEEMKVLLASDDTTVNDLFEANRALVLATLGAAGQQLDRQIASFDYRAALATVYKLTTQMPND